MPDNREALAARLDRHIKDCEGHEGHVFDLYFDEQKMVAEALRSRDPAVGATDMVEDIAKWLHDETAHPESYPSHTWPETERDDGRRAGGWVKIVPQHAQEYFRDIARRLVTRLSAPSPASSREAVRKLLLDFNNALDGTAWTLEQETDKTASAILALASQPAPARET